MTRHVGLRAVGAVALLLAPALLLLPAAQADHTCPLFERKRYDIYVTIPLGGDLVAVEHLVGFTDFRECYEIRNRITKDDVRFETRGGAYVVRVYGDGIDAAHVLREGARESPWYDLRDIQVIQLAGVARDGTVSADAGVGISAAPLDADAGAAVRLR